MPLNAPKLGRAFGRLRVPDLRDEVFPMRAIAKVRSKRISRYWPDHYWRGDQGDKPQCVGFAWVGWLEAGPVRSTGPRPIVSPAKVWRNAQKIDEFPGESPDQGTSVRAGADVLRKLGFIRSYHWEFRAIDTIVDALLEVGPIVVGTDWYAGMSDVGRRAVMRVGGMYEGGHAYLLTGVNRTTGMLRVTNSWGAQWGDQGRAQIAIAEFETLLLAGGEACLAVEVKRSL